MTISGQLYDRIRQMYDDGMTQDEVSQKLGIVRSSLSRILSRQRTCDQMTIATLEKAFPGAVLDLSGTAPAATPAVEDKRIFDLVVQQWNKLTTADRADLLALALTRISENEKRKSETA